MKVDAFTGRSGADEAGHVWVVSDDEEERPAGHEAFEKEVALQNFEQQKLDFEFEQEKDVEVEAEEARCAFTIRMAEGAIGWNGRIKSSQSMGSVQINGPNLNMKQCDGTQFS